MTTVIGIKTNDGSETIVLAADRQVTVEDEERAIKHTNFKKLYHDKAQQFAFGFSGLINDTLTDFYETLMASQADKVLTILKSKVFKEVKDLNIKNAIGKEQKEFDEDNTSSFIFGTREGNLYLVHPMGAIEPAKFVAIGSGSVYAENYLEKEIDDNSIARKDIDIKAAIEMAVGSLKSANKDVSTSGIDITIISHKGIRNYGDDIYNAMNDAKKRKIQQIIKIYQKKKKRKESSTTKGKEKKAKKKKPKKKPSKKKAPTKKKKPKKKPVKKPTKKKNTKKPVKKKPAQSKKPKTKKKPQKGKKRKPAKKRK